MRVALITGGNGVIGEAIATGVARAPSGWEVVLVCRDELRARRAVANVRAAAGHERVRYELADLGRRGSIQALAARWQGPLDVLVNNAAQTPRQRTETPEGIEAQWATNVLGYHWMIQAFAPVLRRSAPARVVNVASYWAGGLDLGDPEFRRRPYDNGAAYRQSKQANRMLARAHSRRLPADSITVNACHPGDVPSRLASNLGFGGHESPKQAAATPVWLALGAVGGVRTGAYFERARESSCGFCADEDAVERLYGLCEGYGGA